MSFAKPIIIILIAIILTYIFGYIWYKNDPLWVLHTNLSAYVPEITLMPSTSQAPVTTKPVLPSAWACVGDGRGNFTHVRKNINSDIECMSSDKKNCYWKTSQSNCENDATFKEPLSPLECGAMHAALYGNTGYDVPTHWCASGKRIFDSPSATLPWVTFSAIDFSDNEISNTITTDQSSCTALCQANASCKGAVFTPSSKSCSLKNAISGNVTQNNDRIMSIPPINANSMIYSWNKFANMDHAGDDIVCLKDGSKADKCQSLCSAHKSCASYNEVTPFGNSDWASGGCCIKKSGVPLSQANFVNTWKA